ncbi:hypothetical protein SAMN05444000_104198 [Shimia gijangensis]|uniref:MetA-pathway of phenol degradation n=1 Tax=Shimia gijangensis TaxID=1470563 RepID=A0A1M6FY31_9RHOB|nr:hypothetical protein [Shimia gijangensis]SHJ02658.1 hypothetical protein SAMN05444000_104198 [Shimia gijangensis]
MKMSGIKLVGVALIGVIAAVGIPAQADENASNPLAATNNTDFRLQTYDLNGSASKQDAFIDGAFMLRDNLKIKYELHYNSTDITGTRYSGFEQALLKAIYFPSDKKLNDTWGMRTAIGLDWAVDLGNTSQGIGSGTDTLAPFGGIAFANLKTGLTLIPLIQHFESYNGTSVSTTAARLIALQPFAEKYWAKLDLILPYDWNTGTVPATAEIQIGYNVNKKIAVYGDVLVGLGSNRPFDKGIGIGLRLKY